MSTDTKRHIDHICKSIQYHFYLKCT